MDNKWKICFFLYHFIVWPKHIFLKVLTELSKSFKRMCFILVHTPAQILGREDCSLILTPQLLHALLSEMQR